MRIFVSLPAFSIFVVLSLGWLTPHKGLGVGAEPAEPDGRQRQIRTDGGKFLHDSQPCGGPPPADGGIYTKTCHFLCDVSNSCRYSQSSKTHFCLCPKLGKDAQFAGRCFPVDSSIAPAAPAAHKDACVKHCSFLDQDPKLCRGGDILPVCVCHTNGPKSPS